MGGELLQAGVGGRPILLVHGFTGAKEDFGEVVPRLGEAGWHAVAPDLRGHGPGPHPAGEPCSLAGYADDIGVLADRLGWERFVLLGHSMGGMAAQLFALANPGRVRALVLMNTGHGPVEGVDPEAAAWARGVVEAGGLAALADELRGKLGSPSHRRLVAERPGYAEWGDEKLLACSAEMWLAMSSELVEHEDRLDRLAWLDVPTLVIVGDEDEAFLGQSERMAKVMPDARLVVVSGAGHAPQFEQPEAWWHAVAAFLEGVA